MTDNAVHIHVEEDLAGVARRFVDAWRAAERGEAGPRDHITFIGMPAFLAAMTPKRLELLRQLRREGPMSVRALAGQLGRDYKSVHRDVSALGRCGLIARTAHDRIAVEWDRMVTELDLAA
jgi:predicted transcriptional regulator